MVYLILIGSIIGVSFGQILFKKAALMVPSLPASWYLIFNPYFLAALLLYVTATLVWVWILQYLPLSRAYMFMAAGFINVPILSWYFFGEPLNIKFFLGSFLIITGVVLTALK